MTTIARSRINALITAHDSTPAPPTALPHLHRCSLKALFVCTMRQLNQHPSQASFPGRVRCLPGSTRRP